MRLVRGIVVIRYERPPIDSDAFVIAMYGGRSFVAEGLDMREQVGRERVRFCFRYGQRFCIFGEACRDLDIRAPFF